MNLLKALAGSAVLAGLLLGTGGCELITSPDRSKIEPTGGGGAGGETGGGGSGGMPTGGGGTGGGCVPVDDKKECTDDVCDANGMPVSNPKTAGDACTEGGGSVCDGNGNCVECLQDANCTAPQVCDDKNMCVDPTCRDGKLNGSETDQDCGGPDCPACVDGKVCVTGTDCESGVCADDGSGGLLCAVPVCGDGVQNGDDGCDDGNMENGDGCDNNCKPTGCGNGAVDSNEQCDDGNPDNGDGCDNNCKTTACGNGIETMGEACDDGNLDDGDGCDSNCTMTGCGNGVTTGTEACDDGNQTNGDGCDNNCTIPGCGNGVQAGTEACDDGNQTNGDGCDNNCTVTACGNGIPAGTEACDDGNQTNGDGCDNNCTASACGNGVQAGTEACDDGNNVNGDGCDNNCTVTACGNGILTGTEACDDGNTANGDCCDSACQVEAGCETEPNNTCGAEDGPLTPNPTALFKGGITPSGDLDIFSFTLAGPGVQSVKIESFQGYTAGSCTSIDTEIQLRAPDCTTVLITDDDDGLSTCSLIDPTVDVAARKLAPGTYFVRANEYNNDASIAQYSVQVTIISTCGNGVVEPTESCDDGDIDNGDGCSNLCNVEPGFFCQGNMPSVCAAPEVNCGDGVDNNGAFGIDALDPSCQVPGFTACAAGQQLFVIPNSTSVAIPDATPAGITSNVTVSNAGTIARVAVLYNITHAFDADVDVSLVTPLPSTIDICSDNGSSGDNFVNTLLDPTCATNVTAGSAPFTGCFIPENAAQVTALGGQSANGTWGLKVVDDASPDPGVLNSWTLVLCTTVCGDGQTGGAEQCDDGNMTNGDGCDNNCKTTACGNGVQTGTEACDDGNTTNGDGCDNNCTVSGCGNGIVAGAEACDDGNGDGADGCTTCVVDPGYTCTGSPSTCTFTCGNGTLSGNEQCDDGDLDPGDGCSATCTIEAGFQCTSAPPSACTAQEVACDDGADNDGDGNMDAADADCAVPAYFPACGAGEALKIYRSVNVPQAIPDTNATGITSAINVSGSGTIQRLAVLFDITHEFDGDVDMTLTPPGAAGLDICSDNGGGGLDFTATVLDTTCATNVTAGSAPFSGCFKPEASFASFTGSTAGNGVWTLKVVDDGFGDIGTLNSWAILLCTTP